MSDEPKKELPDGYVSPLDLIDMIFWGPKLEPEEPETMTTAEVIEYLGTTSAHLTKWKDKGVLVPLSRGKYDAATVRAFVKPSSTRKWQR